MDVPVFITPWLQKCRDSGDGPVCHAASPLSLGGEVDIDAGIGAFKGKVIYKNY